MASILIVEDDAIFRETLARSFERRGWRAFTADSITAARAQFGERPEYAVVDLRIAEENGLVLIPELKQALPDIRILMLTGYASIAMAVEAVKLGASNFLPKPADTDEIIAALQVDAPAPEMPLPEDRMSVRRLTWEHVQRVLNENDGNISATARALGMHRRSLQRFLAKRPAKR